METSIGLNLFTLALVLAPLTGLFIAYCFATRGNPERDIGRRGWLEIAWPIFFLCACGLLLLFLELAAVMLIAIAICFVIWLIDRLLFKKKRTADQLEPASVDMAKAFFPVLAIVFVVRAFWIEPFRIPSGSMIPTLLVGDFILVNKYAYGVRIPVLNKKVMNVGEVKRGDVVVFRYPLDPTKDYIKRAIGLPGDTIEFRGKNLYVNEKEIPVSLIGNVGAGGLEYKNYQVFKEKLGEVEHTAQVDPNAPSVRVGELALFRSEQLRQNCQYDPSGAGFKCKVPPGHYLMIGDNRDNSTDGRYWGFVPDDHLRGRAFLVWMNFGDFKRVGESIK
jgi:signal peptidase I